MSRPRLSGSSSNPLGYQPKDRVDALRDKYDDARHALERREADAVLHLHNGDSDDARNMATSELARRLTVSLEYAGHLLLQARLQRE